MKIGDQGYLIEVGTKGIREEKKNGQEPEAKPSPASQKQWQKVRVRNE